MKKCKSNFGDYKCHVKTSLKDSSGRFIYVDKCLKEAIENLNKQDIKTIASCCGHGIIQPSIIINLKREKMKETQEILIKMGFKNINNNVWQSEWFGVFILIKDATPEKLGRFIYNRGVSRGIAVETSEK